MKLNMPSIELRPKADTMRRKAASLFTQRKEKKKKYPHFAPASKTSRPVLHFREVKVRERPRMSKSRV